MTDTVKTSITADNKKAGRQGPTSPDCLSLLSMAIANKFIDQLSEDLCSIMRRVESIVTVMFTGVRLGILFGISKNLMGSRSGIVGSLKFEV